MWTVNHFVLAVSKPSRKHYSYVLAFVYFVHKFMFCVCASFSCFLCLKIYSSGSLNIKLMYLCLLLLPVFFLMCRNTFVFLAPVLVFR